MDPAKQLFCSHSSAHWGKEKASRSCPTFQAFNKRTQLTRSAEGPVTLGGMVLNSHLSSLAVAPATIVAKHALKFDSDRFSSTPNKGEIKCERI